MKTKINPRSISDLKDSSPLSRVVTRSHLPATHIAFTSFARATFRIARNARLLLFSVAVLLTSGAATVRGQSALDGFNPNANGFVHVVVTQSDGKILIGGEFTSLSPNGGAPVQRNHIARLNPDGTLDVDFNPDANEIVRAIAVQADGNILAGGDFHGANSIGGADRNYLARLNAITGSVMNDDLTFPNASGPVYSLAVQANRQILVGGVFHGANSIGGAERNYIARLEMTGAVDMMFNPNAQNAVFAIVMQGDGKILVGGFFHKANSIGGADRNNIARLERDGTADMMFDPDANDVVRAIAVQADGKILIGGGFTSVDGQVRNRIARLDATTGKIMGDDLMFDPNASNPVLAIAMQADGKILVGGQFNGANSIGGANRNFMARLKTTGEADLTFNPNASLTVLAIAVQPDGKILAGGIGFNGANSIDGQTRNGIARLETDGRLDQTLDLGFVDGLVYATAVQPDGKILIGGDFTTVFGNVRRNNIARLNADGTLDSFDPDADNAVNAIAVQSDGQILIGGDFTRINNVGGLNAPNSLPILEARYHIARLNGDGTLDRGFQAFANAPVYSIAVQADTRILVGGVFDMVASSNLSQEVPRSHVARFEATGEVDLPFSPDADDEVYTIAVEANNNILVGGAFTHIASVELHGIARLNPAGALVPLNSGANGGVVDAIAVQANGRILAGGDFLNIGGSLFKRLARLNSIGEPEAGFDPNANDIVYSISVPADGKILAGGAFHGANSIGGADRNYIARLDAATGKITSEADLMFDPDANGEVYAIAVQADGKILVGGNFGSGGQPSIGGQPRNAFARLSNNIAALQKLTVSQNIFWGNIIWTRNGSSPQFTRVTFDYSTNNVTYSRLGNGKAAAGKWFLATTSLRFPTNVNFYIRARGYYRSGRFNGSESITETVRNAFIRPTRLKTATAINLSTRAQIVFCCAENSEGSGPLVPTGSAPAIGGFIITGNAPKHVLIRAIGPSLSAFGVPGALQDPVLELHGPDTFATITNDNWRDDPEHEAQILATGLPPTDDRESAIEATLDPGAYTALVTGNGNASGVALVEVYDVDEEPVSTLANISTRAFVGTGDNILIAGVILGNGDGDGRIVVRGIGPSLTAFGVPNALADPTLELRDNNGALLISNNDWQENPEQAAELSAAGLAPTNQLESGMAAALPPGLYTALLAGLNNGTGVGLVEVYDLGAP